MREAGALGSSARVTLSDGMRLGPISKLHRAIPWGTAGVLAAVACGRGDLGLGVHSDSEGRPRARTSTGGSGSSLGRGSGGAFPWRPHDASSSDNSGGRYTADASTPE